MIISNVFHTVTLSNVVGNKVFNSWEIS